MTGKNMEASNATPQTCIVCGAALVGRSDKKYCSIECKNAYNNEKQNLIRNYKSRVITSLNNNYRILDHLLMEHVDSVPICDLELIGFKPKLVTGYKKAGTQKTEFRCFDIAYFQNDYRIYRLARIEKH